MARNPDPKPGRWILPLVVLGMVFFTWAFVQRLDPAEVPDDVAVSTTSTTVGTTEPDAVESTTTTTIPELLAAYVSDIRSDQETLDAILTEIETVNTAWEARDSNGTTFSEAVAGFEAVIVNATVFRDSVSIHIPPAGFGDGLGTAHQAALTASERVLTEAEAVLAGLRASDTGQARQAAMLDFRAAVEEFNLAAGNIETAVEAAALGA
jgi:hypothetical protein